VELFAGRELGGMVKLLERKSAGKQGEGTA
jgi:hypothetical protein